MSKNAYIRMFLNASALQVFLITFILPLFIQGITIIIGVLIDSSLPFKLLFPLLVLTLIPGYFGWLYSVGTQLQSRKPVEKGNVSLLLMKAAIIVIDISLFLLAIILLVFHNEASSDSATNGAYILIIVTLALVFLVSYLYAIHSITLSLKTFDNHNYVIFQDYFTVFFLIYFYPVGLWVIQPRIKSILNNP
jgi:hypothetical protein